MEIPEFYHYKGSLTTPHCNEVVSWFVYKYPLDVSPNVLKILEDKWIANQSFSNGLGNARPVQPLNGRAVYEVTANVQGNNRWKLIVRSFEVVLGVLLVLLF